LNSAHAQSKARENDAYRIAIRRHIFHSKYINVVTDEQKSQKTTLNVLKLPNDLILYEFDVDKKRQ